MRVRQADSALLGRALHSPSAEFVPGADLASLSAAVAEAAGTPSTDLLVVPAFWAQSADPAAAALVCLGGRPTAAFTADDALLVQHVLR